ncbi:MAG: disulfide bond formation protein B [Holosporales bacterium]
MFHMRFTVAGLLAASVGSLAMALFFEHRLGLAPCVLCYYQRGLFFLLMLTSLTALLCFEKLSRRAHLTLTMGPLGAIFSLSTYQSLIERHILDLPQACRGSLSQWSSVDQLREQMLKKPLPACDVVQWQVFGLSLSDLAVIFAVGAGIWVWLSYQRMHHAQ